MNIKPTGRAKKAYEAGYKAREEGIEMKDNPNKFGSDVALSSWWESGWYAANNELEIVWLRGTSLL